MNANPRKIGQKCQLLEKKLKIEDIDSISDLISFAQYSQDCLRECQTLNASYLKKIEELEKIKNRKISN